MKNFLNKLNRASKTRSKFRTIIDYLVGNFRYLLYYSEYKFVRKLMRTSIREQISLRILLMNEECYNTGNCIHCGCSTTALQMCNSKCEGDCYPKMMDSIDWYIVSTYNNKRMTRLIQNNKNRNIVL